MYSLLIHQRYVEFWRDMWFILLQPISELPPGPQASNKTHRKTTRRTANRR